MNQLDRLERLVQRFIEGPFKHLFQTQLQPSDLLTHLTLTIEQELSTRPENQHIPNYYQIILNPSDYALLIDGSSYRAEIDKLHQAVTDLIEQANYQPCGLLRIFLERSEMVPPGQVNIKTDCIPSRPHPSTKKG